MKQLSLFDIPIQTTLLGKVEFLLQGFEIKRPRCKPWEQKLFAKRAGAVYEIILYDEKFYVGRLNPVIPCKWVRDANDVIKSISEWESESN